MTTHQMRLTANPFNKILNGQKTIESRLFDEKRRQIKIGDAIEFTQNDDPAKKITAKVVRLHKYQTFEEMFSGLSPSLFGGQTKEELLGDIRKYYSPDEEKELGVIGIEIVKV